MEKPLGEGLFCCLSVSKIDLLKKEFAERVFSSCFSKSSFYLCRPLNNGVLNINQRKPRNAYNTAACKERKKDSY